MVDFLGPRERWFAVAAASAVATLGLVYVAVLAVGLLTLPSAEQQIQEPCFTLMEILILAIAPAMVALTVALHAWSQPHLKSFALAAVVFMSMCAAVTCTVHFAILTLSRKALFAQSEWSQMVFSFQWPSVVYALDILAWDIFFPLAALFAAAAVHGTGLATGVRTLLYASATLAFVGLAGVPLANMEVRNVGIVGYAVLFPVAAVLLVKVFLRTNNASLGQPFH